MSQTFTSPPNRLLFEQQVWQMVKLIPAGKVASYGQIAALIPPPGGMDAKSYLAFGPRWVGGAMANCPESVPWQRVVNAQGKISQRPGARRQHELLEGEGVEFDEHDKIDMKVYGWEGP
jgi:methylated-DNA-protein-cysteine methyltransferase-like protein